MPLRKSEILEYASPAEQPKRPRPRRKPAAGKWQRVGRVAAGSLVGCGLCGWVIVLFNVGMDGGMINFKWPRDRWFFVLGMASAAAISAGVHLERRLRTTGAKDDINVPD